MLEIKSKQFLSKANMKKRDEKIVQRNRKFRLAKIRVRHKQMLTPAKRPVG